MTPVQSSASWNLIESALEETMALVAKASPTPRTRAILVEARRLRSSIASWRAIPPRPDTRKEVFDTAMTLLSKAGVEAHGGGRPSALQSDAPFASAVTSSRPPRFSSAPPSASPPSPRSAAVNSTVPPGPKEQILTPGITLLRPKAMDWQPFPSQEGVTMKVLHRELAGVVLHALVRLAAGAEIPKHRHAQVEDILVLDGILVLGAVTMRSGEYSRAEAGSVHPRAQAPNGCTFLLIGSEKNEVLPD